MEGTALPVTDGAVRPRRAYLDNLKVVLVVGVIVGHVLITYADVGTWAYRETSVNDAFLIPAALVVALGSLFAMGVFFLIAGLMTPGPLARKGPALFLRDRALRLALPFLVFLLLLYPAVKWVGERGAQPLGWYLRAQLRDLDPGPLWFVLALLLFSVGYVAWRQVRPRSPDDASDGPARAGRARRRASPRRPSSPACGSPSTRVRCSSCTCGSGRSASGCSCWASRAQRTAGFSRCRDGPAAGPGCSAIVGLLAVVGAFADRPRLDRSLRGRDRLAGRARRGMRGSPSCWPGRVAARLLPGPRRPRRSARPRDGPGSLRRLRAPGSRRDRASPSSSPPGRCAPEIKFLVVAPVAVAASFGLAWLLTRIPGVRRVV